MKHSLPAVATPVPLLLNAVVIHNSTEETHHA